MVATKQNEEFVYQSVTNGDLVIDRRGRIWRVRKRGWDRWQRKAVHRPCKKVRAEHDCGEYFQVRVMIEGVRVYALAHRLIWRHFKGPIPIGLTVNHKDGRKKRNCLGNLELATYSDQQIHAARVLKVGHACNQNGEKNNMAALSDAQVAEIRRRRLAGEKLQLIADDFEVAFQTISKIARGERRTG